MITPKDDLLHPPASSDDSSWAETNYFGFCVPEHGLNGELYALFRPNSKIALSGVWIWKDFLKNPNEALFVDHRVHLPMPDTDLSDYRLPNGLGIKVLEPLRRYRIEYDSGSGTELHLTFQAWMPPFDIHDETMNPLAGDRRGAVNGMYMGHFDQTGGVTGELTLNGRRYAIDYPSTRDHSWGPRSEAGIGGPMQYDCGHFGKDLAFHILAKVHRNLTDATVLHGYVFESGEVHPLVRGVGKIRRDGYEQRDIDYELVDAGGRTFHFAGRARSLLPWMMWPNICVYTSLTEWDHQGRVGYGDAQHVFPMSYVRQRRTGPAG